MLKNLLACLLNFNAKMIIRFPSHISLIDLKSVGRLINSSTFEQISIDETGLMILKNVSHDFRPIDEIISVINKEYEVEREKLRSDISLFFQELQGAGYLEIIEEMKPRTLTLELTKQCNSRCVHCYIPNKHKNESGHLEMNLIRKILSEFKSNGGESVTLTGGEALLSPNFLPTISLSNSLGFSINVLSNLCLMTVKVADYLANNNVSFVQTSIYGANDEVHDEITGLKGSFDKTLRGIRLLKERNIDVRIVYVPMKGNVSMLIDAIKFFRNEYHIDLSIETVLTPAYDRTTENLKERLSIADMNKMLQDLKAFDYDKFIKTVKVRSKQKLITASPTFIIDPVCDGLHQSIYLTSEGEITTCPDFQSYSFGNVTNNSLTEIIHNPASLKIRGIKVGDLEKCLRCDAYDYCKWCIGLSFAETGKFTETIQFWCDQAFMIKELVEN